MNYILKHKDINVLMASLNDVGNVQKVLEVYNEEHLPVNIQKEKYKAVGLQEFLRSRIIPNERLNWLEVMNSYNTKSSFDLSVKSYQVSLVDHYWLMPTNKDLAWDDVNFFYKMFPNEGVFVSMTNLFGSTSNISLHTPNTTLNGTLPQMWTCQNNKLYLLKAGAGYLKQQPFNEVFVADLLNELQFPHVSYDLIEDQGQFLSICPCFTTDEIEFIPAWQIVTQNNKKIGLWNNFIECMKESGLTDSSVVADLQRMVITDYLILNEDRHYNNFGFLRNSNTLQWQGMAPLFDHGNSLWYEDSHISLHRPIFSYKAKTFASTHEKQIERVTLDISDRLGRVLPHIPALVEETFSCNPNFDPERRMALIRGVEKRVQLLIERMDRKEEMQQESQPLFRISKPENSKGLER